MATSPGMARWCREVSHRAEGRWAIQLSIGSSARLPSLSAHAADMPRAPARHRDTLKHTHSQFTFSARAQRPPEVPDEPPLLDVPHALT